MILSIGSTDFTLIGASANTVGLSFIATGVGVGTGTAVDEHSGMEYDISASAITGGSLIDSTHFGTTKNNPNGKDGILGKTIMSLNRTATSDILSGIAIRSSIATANSSSYFSFNWKEIGR